MHRAIAYHQGGSTLEIGAGTLNHRPYEPSSNPYDVVEPNKDLLALSDPTLLVGSVYGSLGEIPVDALYERIISIAVLEHVEDLPSLIFEAVKHLEPGGLFAAGIPSEGSFLWSLGMRCVTGVEFRLKYGLDYQTLMRHEHVNSASEIEEVLRRMFRSVRTRVCGFSRKLSFYQVFECRDSDEGVLQDFGRAR